MNLGALPRVVEGVQLPVPPVLWTADGGAKRGWRGAQEREAPQGLGAEGDHVLRVDQRQRPPEEWCAVQQLASGRGRVPALIVAWVAQDGVGDEHLLTAEAGCVEQAVKAATGLISLEWHPTPVGASAAGRFADENDGSLD